MYTMHDVLDAQYVLDKEGDRTVTTIAVVLHLLHQPPTTHRPTFSAIREIGSPHALVCCRTIHPYVPPMVVVSPRTSVTATVDGLVRIVRVSVVSVLACTATVHPSVVRTVSASDHHSTCWTRRATQATRDCVDRLQVHRCHGHGVTVIDRSPTVPS